MKPTLNKQIAQHLALSTFDRNLELIKFTDIKLSGVYETRLACLPQGELIAKLTDLKGKTQREVRVALSA